MKRFISSFIAAIMVVAAMSTTAFAANKNLVLSADKTTVNAGDNVKILAKLTETTEDIGALQFAITFDPNVFELAEDDFSALQGPPPVISALQKYVPADYHKEYQLDNYASYYQFGSRAINAELREQGMVVMFAYAGGVTAGCGLENKLLGGAYLKVKDDLSAVTNPKTKITVTETDCSYQGVAHNLLTNEIEITLNGVGTVEPPAKAELVEEPEENGKGALETKEDGKKYYTQGFMATLTLNGQTVNAVNFKLKNKDVTIDSANNDKNVEGWSAPFEGEAPFVFAINVVNVPDGETVTCDWYME